MVPQWDAKLSADVRQLRRVDFPLRARKLDGAGEWSPGRPQPVPCATLMEDTLVERRVVGGDELRVVDPGEQRRPKFTEGGRVAHVLPAQAVDSSEREL